MNRTDNEFLELYKRTDKICADMFASETGISTYINQMEESNPLGWANVPGWKDAYYKLKHLRWLRNQLAHEIDPESCKGEDLTDLKTFYEQLLTGKDPLACLAKTKAAGGMAAAGKTGGRVSRDRWEKSKDREVRSTEDRKKNSALVPVLLGIAAVVLVVLLVITI